MTKNGMLPDSVSVLERQLSNLLDIFYFENMRLNIFLNKSNFGTPIASYLYMETQHAAEAS